MVMRNKSITKGLAATATFIAMGCILAACGGEATPKTPPEAIAAGSSTSAPEKGKIITLDDIKLGPIDQAMVAKGRSTYDLKCLSCHSLGEKRIVGPGWKGITQRRESAWIMNMILNVETMLESDPEAQKQLENCLVRMPNQNLSFDEGRQVLEFMRTL